MFLTNPHTLRAVARDDRPLVLHLVFRFDTGGLENGVVNLIDHMHAYRHMVVALNHITDFRHRIQRDDVGFVALRKAPGHGAKAFPALMGLLARERPAVMHTRNLGPLEMQVPAACMGTALRVHGEHGRELEDLQGDNRRLQWARRLYSPFVHRYIALSQDLRTYLLSKVGIGSSRVSQIYNGVDTNRFSPKPNGGVMAIAGCPFDPQHHWLIGTVGRMQGVKHQLLLARAFVAALQQAPQLQSHLRLVMVGEGPLREQCTQILSQAGLASLAWLPGERSDVPDVMRGLNAFVLPSLAEGVSNTILEAMASGLPVLATDVGGNRELVSDGSTGFVLPSDDVQAMAAGLLKLALAPQRAAQMGLAGRHEALKRFSVQAMVAAYQQIYDQHRR